MSIRTDTIDLIQQALREDSAARSEAQCVYDLLSRYPQCNFEDGDEEEIVSTIGKTLEIEGGDAIRAERVYDELIELGIVNEPDSGPSPGF